MSEERDSTDGLATTVAQGTHDPAMSGDIPTLVDRFLIEDELGAGGMGRVYLAYDPTLDRKVAVKLLRKRVGDDKDKASARMAREARAMARLRHPNVVAIHEVGTTDSGEVFLVMEYAPGGTLRDWLASTPEPSWQEVVQMYTYAGRGLAAAHDAGLVHRDFKPDNVLVGDDGRVQVTDFGIANIGEEPPEGDGPGDGPLSEGDRPGDGPLSGPTLTRAASVIGTPAYMSPEQHRGKVVDARGDQFAFCAALYEAMYGVRPFAGETTTEISEAAASGTLAPPVRDRGVAAIGDAIRRGLRPDPAQRFPSMQALLAALAPKPRGTKRWIAIVAALAIIIAVVVLTRGRAVDKPDGAITIESFDLNLASTGRWEWREGVGDVIAILLADIDGFKTSGPSKLLGPDGVREARGRTARTEARATGAYLVRGAIDEKPDGLHAHIQILRDGSELAAFERTSSTLWPLLGDVAGDIAAAIAPGTTLRTDGRERARALVAAGDEHLRNVDFQMARPFLEQAVLADPALFEAWYSLTLVRSWVLAPERQVFDALDTATKIAPTPVQRRLVESIGAYLHHDLPKARRSLEALIAEPSLSKQERRDALYFLGEAHWHDGHHRAGTAYFKQTLDVDLRFKVPISHLHEYALANRDVAMLDQYAPQVAGSTREYRDAAEFISGHYEALARDSHLHLQAVLALGDQPSAEEEAVLTRNEDVQIYRAARALEAGDLDAAKRAIDALWIDIERLAELADNHYYVLRLLGDTLLAAGSTAEATRLVAFLAARSKEHPVRSYQRLAILTAGLTGDRSLIIRRELTERDATLADAIEAELDGDRAKAAALLGELVKDPSPYWDYPERVALLRNLVALKRVDDARALCADTLRPAILQWAFLPARRACKRAM